LGLVSLDVAEPLGAQAQQALGLGVEGIADDVKVQAVLDGLRLRHLVEHDAWSAGVAGEQDRLLGGRVVGNRASEDIGPEPGQGSGIGTVEGVAAMSLSAREQQALESVEDGLAESDPGLASRLGIFSRLASGEEMPERDEIQPIRPSAAWTVTGARAGS
jgi:hypothetical protein